MTLISTNINLGSKVSLDQRVPEISSPKDSVQFSEGHSVQAVKFNVDSIFQNIGQILQDFIFISVICAEILGGGREKSMIYVCVSNEFLLILFFGQFAY